MNLLKMHSTIKQLERYLGPVMNYSSDYLPNRITDRWILSYYSHLKNKFYITLAGRKAKYSKKKGTE